MSDANCHDLARCLSAFVDGELEVSQLVAFEAHVESCEACQSRVGFARACRSSVRNHIKSVQTPDSVRMRAAMAITQVRDSQAHGDVMVGPPRLLSWRVAGPIAAAAAFALVWAAVARMPATATNASGGSDQPAASAASMLSIDSFLEDLVEQHANPLPPETTNPDDVEGFDRFIGVPVRTASSPHTPDLQARFGGARMVPMRGQRAAMLQYTLNNGRRVSVYIYNPVRIRIAASPRLRIEANVTGAPVYVGYVRGYSVAVTDKRGVGYALASDLDEQENSKLLAAVGSAP